jgi:hypothetical protein
MTTLSRVDAFRRLWTMIIEKIECPPDSQIYRWISRFNDAILEHGLTRLRTKILQGSITDADSAGRFLTAVFSAETQRRIVTR